MARTACIDWQVRDIVGHMVDTTESYFASFDTARGAGTAIDPLGVRVFQDVANQGAQAFRSLSQDEMTQRLGGDFATVDRTPSEQFDLGVRVLGHGDYRVSVGPEGLQYATGDISDLSTTIEFDAGSFVLTAFGRVNGGTVRGDHETAERFLNQFFRI